MRAVHFGAGNIGRGFIGLLLSRSGYEVCFIDVNDSLVNLLHQKKGEYTVSLANESQDRFTVSGVSALDGKELEEVAKAIAHADLVTTAVGVNVLKHVAGASPKGLSCVRSWISGLLPSLPAKTRSAAAVSSNSMFTLI